MTSRSEMLLENVRHVNPDTLQRSPAYSQVVEVTEPARTIYISGQNAVDRVGNIVGIGDIGKQAEQIMRNLRVALHAVDADLEHVVKFTIFIVQGQPLEPAYEAYLRAWGNRSNPPTVTAAYVAGLARPEALLEIDAIAVAPL
ncbi:MAG: RidA family protein [Methanomassiliicoccaceae archaeon]|jgi:enamine deaminase RidA (YjgF/YER057c/UK114 family)|nr:RidA family protein [Methanomassiliicoccaceae archaeon]